MYVIQSYRYKNNELHKLCNTHTKEYSFALIPDHNVSRVNQCCALSEINK